MTTALCLGVYTLIVLALWLKFILTNTRLGENATIGGTITMMLVWFVSVLAMGASFSAS